MSKVRWGVYVVVVLVLAGVGVGQWQHRCEREGLKGPGDVVREAGFEALVGAGEQKQYVKWEGYTVRPSQEQLKRMPKARISSGVYGGGVTMHVRTPSTADESGLKQAQVSCGGLDFEIVGSYDGDSIHFGAAAFRVDPTIGRVGILGKSFLYDREPSRIIDCSVRFTFTGSNNLECVSSSTPIGEKGATHAKEMVITETWGDAPVGSPYTVTLDDLSYTGDLSEVDGGIIMAFGFDNAIFDPDDWAALGKYAFAFEDITFCDEPVDLSAFTPRIWLGSGDSALWAEGTADGTIGLWGGNNPYNYATWPGGAVNAPYSIDFSNYNIRWMSGAYANSVKVWCPAIRLLNESGDDIGPWSGTMDELKAKGRIRQTTGMHTWDTSDPDLTGNVTLYLDYDSMVSHGMIDHPAPTYKVEACMYRGDTITVDPETGDITPADSFVNGDYWVRGRKNEHDMLTNGLYWIWALDSEGTDWAIGPDPSVPPYYVTIDGGGLANIYHFDESSGYLDAIVNEELGWKRFTGLTGLGPVVSLQNSPANPDTSIPSFSHDGTCTFKAWPLSATSRTEDGSMTDLVTLRHKGETWEQVDGQWQITGYTGTGIYADAHTHEDWVASEGVTVPDANGNFTVTASGATLTLNVASNYLARQAAVGQTGAISVPTAYWAMRHDALFGETYEDPDTHEILPVPSEVNHEAIYSWLGWGYLRPGFVVPEGLDSTTIGMTIQYYNHLDGVSDNHKSDGSRQTEYSFNAGELHTYNTSHTLTQWDEETREARFLVDLYWAEEPLALVTTIKFTFTDTGDYQIAEPELWPDPGDPQTGRPEYVRPGATVAVHGSATKSFQNYLYAQGGLSVCYDGIYDRGLYMPDNAKANQIEKCFPFLNVVIGAKSGLDFTAPFALAGLPINTASDAWEWVYDSGAEEAHMKDDEDAVLKTLTTIDLPDTIGELPIPAVCCYQINCVAGLPYSFHGTKYVGGLGHGMAKATDTTRKRGTYDVSGYPLLRVGTIYRRPEGSEDSNYVVHDSDVRVDEHGHWHGPGDYTDPFTDGPDSAPSSSLQVMWEYAIKGTSKYESMGWFPVREFVSADVLLSLGGELYVVEQMPSMIYLLEYRPGNGIKIIYTSDPGQYLRDGKSLGNFQNPYQLVEDEDTDGCPSGYVDKMAVLRVYHLKDGDLKRLVSNNWGSSWEEATTVISGEDIAKSVEAYHEGRQYCIGVDSSGNLYCYASNSHFDDAAWTLDTNKFLIVTGADTETMPSFYTAHGKFYAYAFVGDDRKGWTSDNFGRTWTEIGA